MIDDDDKGHRWWFIVIDNEVMDDKWLTDWLIDWWQDYDHDYKICHNSSSQRAI